MDSPTGDQRQRSQSHPALEVQLMMTASRFKLAIPETTPETVLYSLLFVRHDVRKP